VVIDENFNRRTIGDDWRVTGDGVRIEDGSLVVSGARNHPLWLKRPIPHEVRIEFDAWAATKSGDIKVEIAGDGHSYATTVSYTATGYVLIFGGWDNKLSIIARKNEHGEDRETRSSPSVDVGHRYHFVITRSQNELRWGIDGQEFLTMIDPQPLTGPENQFFAFNGWEAETRFDNLKITDLSTARGLRAPQLP